MAQEQFKQSLILTLSNASDFLFASFRGAL